MKKTAPVQKVARPPTPATDGDSEALRRDASQPQHSTLEHTEHLDPPSNTPAKQTHCRFISISTGVLRWLYIAELLLWIVVFVVASYFVML